MAEDYLALATRNPIKGGPVPPWALVRDRWLGKAGQDRVAAQGEGRAAPVAPLRSPHAADTWNCHPRCPIRIGSSVRTCLFLLDGRLQEVRNAVLVLAAVLPALDRLPQDSQAGRRVRGNEEDHVSRTCGAGDDGRQVMDRVGQ